MGTEYLSKFEEKVINDIAVELMNAHADEDTLAQRIDAVAATLGISASQMVAHYVRHALSVFNGVPKAESSHDGFEPEFNLSIARAHLREGEAYGDKVRKAF